ncbi:glycolate dehydrogenase [Acanthamoeba castellanii str. Neff]|uniref:D-lactate dehydrogenase (cytochrome) n=1 Tax=Acanthamoeba castellanii (strain ATCC 30010 / Neff) TaxID=1257118 RepID=L8GYP8_ACACF|nr:glycolate dehydrogenase [Acanthamoeba castellanii str. Neff]ELR17648.1 glycolate dehydrogenase [Acanthamoeba castellanii str. Neff]
MMLRGRVLLRRPLHCAACLPPPATARLLAPSVPAAVRSWSTLSSPRSVHTEAHTAGKGCGPACSDPSHAHSSPRPTKSGGQQLPENYAALARELRKFLREDQVVSDPLRTLAYGTDASFYRLIPKLVVQVEREDEVVKALGLAERFGAPITFRAAGTSLSGQAITDSVLLRLVPSKWSHIDVLDPEGSRVRLQPGVIGGQANKVLGLYGRKIGPDPSSIESCMIGGITANNSSGMCCGTRQNTYNTIEDIRIVLADGTVLDTASQESRERFSQSHGHLLSELSAMAHHVQHSNPDLLARIKRKYSIKNTTGYSINALADFTDPFEILKHLIVGSEGTLAFISGVTMRTVPELPHKASSIMLFPDVITACEAVSALKLAPVDAVELMDRACLVSARDKLAQVGLSGEHGQDVAILLVETRADTTDELADRVEHVAKAVRPYRKVKEVQFTSDPRVFNLMWDVRRGIIPSAGAMRPVSTSVILEDVAVEVPRLAAMTMDLQDMFKRHRYDDAVIFGHALDGNLHLLFAQGFDSRPEQERYGAMMDELCAIVATKYGGSLKAEHGTGRNVAPFVEMEWGKDGYALMKDIKKAFDPHHLLNPGVLLNDDPQIHVKNLKPMPAAHSLVDQCIECGFCEKNCPSRELTLSPRQRIVIWREIQQLRRTKSDPARLAELEQQFRYAGDDTCAADGMCATACPVNINTGQLIKTLRATERSPWAQTVAQAAADHFALVNGMGRTALQAAHVGHRVVGARVMRALSDALHRVLPASPQWNPHLPRGGHAPSPPPPTATSKDQVVYFPSCANRVMGVSTSEKTEGRALPDVALSVLGKAGYDVILPEGLAGLCCGMAFESRGFPHQARQKADELHAVLWRASDHGRLPVLFDMSPCALHAKTHKPTPDESLGLPEAKKQQKLEIFEPVEFTHDFLLSRLQWTPREEGLVYHTTCSSKRMAGVDQKFLSVLKQCTGEAPAKRLGSLLLDSAVPCCGMAGDRGLCFPELPRSALKKLRERVASHPPGCSEGVSNSRTCEVALSEHAGVPFRSVLYLVDRASSPLNPAAAPSTSAALHALLQRKAAAYAIDPSGPAPPASPTLPSACTQADATPTPTGLLRNYK